MGTELKIVCFGDSLTVCGEPGGTYPDFLKNCLPDHTYIIRGIPGDTLGGGKKRFQADVLDHQPDILIFELGANDYWLRNRSLRSLLADYEEMISSARRNGIEVVIASCLGTAYRPGHRIDWDQLHLTQEECAAGIAAIEHDLTKRYRCFNIPDIQIDIRPNGREPYWIDYCHPNANGNRLVALRIKAEVVKAIRRINKR